ncbi:MAG: hypothetical protein ACO1N3_01520 [Gammaproteobacteria bacterium]
MTNKSSLSKISSVFFMGLLQAVNIAVPQKKKTKMQQSFAPQELSVFKKPPNTIKKPILTEDSQYYAEVYLTNANRENGPGHISASFIKIKDSQPQVITHTSYMPGIAGIINGVFLGFVPVLARNYPDIREEDVKKSDTIIRLPLTENEFRKGVARQQQIEERTNIGLQMYAITGAFNPVASFLVGLFSAYQGSEITIKNFQKKNAVSPSEDHLGIVVSDSSHHPESYTHTDLMNCTAAVQSVLEAVGLKFEEDFVIPVALVKSLEKLPDSKIVDHSLVNPENNQITEDSEDDLDIPEP